MFEILKAGGFTTGGLNYDAKVRRQSTDKYDLFYGHIGAMDTMALSLKIAAKMIEDGELDRRVAKRYSGWNGEFGQQILQGKLSLDGIAQYAQQNQLAPQHQSGHQELLETWLIVIFWLILSLANLPLNRGRNRLRTGVAPCIWVLI